MYASIEYATHFHVHVEDWKDRNEIVPKGRVSWQSVQKTRKGGSHRSEKCNDLGGQFKCMRCGMRSKREQIIGTFVVLGGNKLRK